MDPATDRARLARLKRGEARAFDEVYDELRPRVYSFLVRLSRRRDVAEELLQETFLRLAANASSLDDDTRIAAWLFTVARNQWVSHVRMAMVESDRIDRLSLEDPDHPPTPFEEAAATETEARLERAIASLPAPLREALLLVGVEGFEPNEAAKMIGIAPEALRQRLSRARAALRSALEEPKLRVLERA